MKAVLKYFKIRLMTYGPNEGKYEASAEWTVGKFNFTHTVNASASALIFEVCKGQICAESTKALDKMIKQVKESEEYVEEINPQQKESE